jgi:heme/copper-type cytochrome/quinol oxidase subunit 2
MDKLEKYTKTMYSIAAILIMAGVGMVAFLENYQEMAISLINMGAVIIFVTFIRAKRFKNGPMKDERTVKIGSYGLSYSWFVTLIVVAVLFWVNYFGIVQLTVDQVLGLLILVMAVTAKGFQWYLFRKGDVE